MKIYLGLLIFSFALQAQAQSANERKLVATYDSLLHVYNADKNKLSVDDKIFISNMAKRVRKDSLANSIAKNVIDELSDDKLLKEKNLRFIINNTHHSIDRGFNLYLQHAKEIDRLIADPGFAEKSIATILITETPGLSGAEKEPNWRNEQKRLTKKYGNDFATETVLIAKTKYYRQKNDSTRYVKAINDLVGKFPSGFSKIDLNNYGYEIFFYSEDLVSLNKAITWLNPIVNMPNSEFFFDTYANLLYKVGKKSQAIEWETKALASRPNDKDIQTALDKMKKGQPTWK